MGGVAGIDLFAALSERLPGEPAVSPDEALLLFALVRATAPGVVVETGTNRGASAVALALGASTVAPQGHVHSFDPQRYGHLAWARLGKHGLGEYVTLHHRSSLDPPDDVRDVQFAFFDVGDGPSDPGAGNGAHTAGYLLREWEVWRPRLVPGALCVWHDAPPGSPGLDALRTLDARGEIALCSLPTSCAMALGMVGRDTWQHPALAGLVRDAQARRLAELVEQAA